MEDLNVKDSIIELLEATLAETTKEFSSSPRRDEKKEDFAAPIQAAVPSIESSN